MCRAGGESQRGDVRGQRRCRSLGADGGQFWAGGDQEREDIIAAPPANGDRGVEHLRSGTRGDGPG